MTAVIPGGPGGRGRPVITMPPDARALDAVYRAPRDLPAEAALTTYDQAIAAGKSRRRRARSRHAAPAGLARRPAGLARFRTRQTDWAANRFERRS
jgi:hypothetical protein